MPLSGRSGARRSVPHLAEGSKFCYGVSTRPKVERAEWPYQYRSLGQVTMWASSNGQLQAAEAIGEIGAQIAS
jgi:hypothetical protein